MSRKVVGQEGGAKVEKQRLPCFLQSPCLELRWLGVVRGPATKTVRQGFVSLSFPSSVRPPKMTAGHADELGPMLGRDRFVSHVSKHRCPVDLPLAQCQHLLPRRESSNPPASNKLRKRTFLFQPNRTFLFQYYTPAAPRLAHSFTPSHSSSRWMPGLERAESIPWSPGSIPKLRRSATIHGPHLFWKRAHHLRRRA